MCGIAGASWTSPPGFVDDIVAAQVEQLRHRGPDDSGSTWFVTDTANALLIQTRLSIIDLSHAGHQPMTSPDGRYDIVFNGEIYNYVEVREQLGTEGVQFLTETDTEVLLHAWATWGESGLRRLTGMFSFVVLDHSNSTLTLVRDAFGIKPLYFRRTARQFSFSSELASLLALDPTPTSLNWQRCYDYLVHARYDSNEDSFLSDVRHVRPAHLMVYDLTTGTVGTQRRWWSPAVAESADVSLEQASIELRRLLTESVRLHLRSDVPIGTALSGGLDSSAITCLVRELEPGADLRTFSYVAAGSEYDEEHWVDIVNQAVDATPHKVYAGPDDLTANLPAPTSAQGEPYGTTSIYAQFAIYRKAHEAGLVVVLDGQGADELLGGYLGFPAARMLTLWERRDLLGVLRYARRWKRWPNRTAGDQWKGFLEYFIPRKLRGAGLRIVGRPAIPKWIKAEAFAAHGITLERPVPSRRPEYRRRRLTEALVDSLDRLPALLRHADRNSMHFSIESRVPFLTIDLAEFLLSLPEDYLVDDETGTKLVLRKALVGLVPSEVLERRDKIGFATPESTWMLSDSSRIESWLPWLQPVSGFLDTGAMRISWDEYQRGERPFDAAFWRWEVRAVATGSSTPSRISSRGLGGFRV